MIINSNSKEYTAMLEKIKNLVKEILKDCAHDYDHTLRVYNNCMLIAKSEQGADLEVLQVASLLHDIARAQEDSDDSGKTDHAILGADTAYKILRDFGCDGQFAKTVKYVISTHRYRADNPPATLEAKILFDADKLDALGAIGIARSFAIAGKVGETLYYNGSAEDYVKENLVGEKIGGRIKDISKHSFQMEYELKFKLLPQKMYTHTAKQIAKTRLAFMETFIRQMIEEIGGVC